MASSYNTDYMKKKIKTFFFDKLNIELSEEVCVRNTICLQRTSYKGLVDLGTTIVGDNEEPFGDIGIEIKISKGDLYAKTGHNHYLDFNYLAVPVGLYYYAEKYLNERNLKHVGIIVVDNAVHIAKKHTVYEKPTMYLDESTKANGELYGDL